MNLPIVIATAVHLVFVEKLGAILIPFTTQSMLHAMTVRITESDHNDAIHKFTCGSFCTAPDQANRSLAEVINQIKYGITEYMSYPVALHIGETFESSNHLIKGNFGNLLPWVILIVHIWQITFLIFLFVSAIKFFCMSDAEGGSFDFRSGAYFTFTYDLERSKTYNGFVWSLIVLSLLFFATFTIFVMMYESWEFVQLTLGDSVVEFLAWLYGVNNLKNTYSMTFNWDDPAFRQVYFRRPPSLYMLTNRAFAEKLQSALIHAYRNDFHRKDPHLNYFLDPDDLCHTQELLMAKMGKEGVDDPNYHWLETGTSKALSLVSFRDKEQAESDSASSEE
eukprot:TRINITY_DN17191_c0_g1_i1.p1 TRINITY_DN17191_c0_g1~~TRINITY_DN17191_c0_g1_i1.p1  ORF type:complete len:336 (-),score=47.94 TRINITY_DN17191_c0_g1_i1:169-1176(-)